MPDPRAIESMFERGVEGLTTLTRQISRAAYAIERLVRLQVNEPSVLRTCSACHSTIQKHDAKRCLSCGEAMSNG